MRFQFDVPDEVVHLLELSEGKPAEDVLAKHFREWWFNKTHHEARLIQKGKHPKIKKTKDTEYVADTVYKIMYADAQVYTDEDLGIDPKEREEIETLRKVRAPLDPFCRKPTKAERDMLKTPEGKRKRAEEAAPIKAAFREEYAKFQAVKDRIEEFDKRHTDALISKIRESGFQPTVTRIKDGVG